MTNSADSPPSKLWGRPSGLRRAFSPAVVFVALCILAFLSSWWCFAHGYILWYGDAQAHLNLSRGIVDSRTPGYDQLGTVWLPVLHVICLPLVGNNWLWSTGLAGTIPVALCFIFAGTFFYLAALEAYRRWLPAAITVACFALNPNVLYLASIPMTEVVFFAGLALFLFACFRFRTTQSTLLIFVGVFACWWMSLTRYDGWFLIPFAALWFAVFAKRNRIAVFIGFGALAALAPAYWIAHNWWETANPLDFYNGPYSAAAIQGSRPYRGYHNWPLAALYYAKAGQLCAGWTLVALGVVGVAIAARKKTLAPLLFLALTPAFYIWSIHSSGTPIHVPQLWPFSYYNTRYGIAFVPLAAFAAGAIVLALPAKRTKLAFLIPLVCIAPWLAKPSRENWICWKESQVNSVSRRAWTQLSAAFFMQHYRVGQGILASTGDVSGIFCRAQIPFTETLNIGNGPAWLATTSRPDLIHQELWAIAQDGDFLSGALGRQRGRTYRIFKQIKVEGAPAIEIYQRHPQ